jgi:hypothetical protein
MEGLKDSFNKSQYDQSMSTDNLLNDLNFLQSKLGKNKNILSQMGGKKSSKKGSKKDSKKSSKKGSKKDSKKDSKKGSKKDSKKDSKKKLINGGGAKKLPASLAESNKTTSEVCEKLGVKRSPGLIMFVNRKLRIPAKEQVSDEKDYKAVNKKMLELFDDLLKKKSKQQLVSEVEKFAEEAKNNRTKK